MTEAIVCAVIAAIAAVTVGLINAFSQKKTKGEHMTAKKIKVFPPTLNLNAKQDQGGYNAKGHTNRANRRHTDAHINQ